LQFTSVAGPSALNGIVSSTITPTITYNSVDNPVNPTTGKSYLYTMAFTGGPLGGNVNTITNVVEYKQFRPVNKHRNVFGYRARLGRDPVENTAPHDAKSVLREYLLNLVGHREIDIKARRKQGIAHLCLRHVDDWHKLDMISQHAMRNELSRQNKAPVLKETDITWPYRNGWIARCGKVAGNDLRIGVIRQRKAIRNSGFFQKAVRIFGLIKMD